MIEQQTHLNYWDDDTDEVVDHWIIRKLLVVIRFKAGKKSKTPNSVVF
ncbi:MAG: hypothetical protein HC907_34690, partial [Richelia sp. SM1_7_0]|nr:hypothetical protein [Richelia sp. SM1_7_0]